MTQDSFQNFVSRLGVGPGSENAMSAGNYTFNLITRNPVKLEAAYRGSWIVGNLVDSVADDMTRAGIKISSNDSEEDFKDLKSNISRLSVSQSLASLIKWGRLYGGSIAVIQIKGQNYATPLSIDTVAKDQFQGLTVYDRWQVIPDMTDIIPSGPDMGLPRFYDIILTPIVTPKETPDLDGIPKTGRFRVHHSRLIRYIGIELPYRQAITETYWGESILERLWDRLLAFDNATLSSANLVDKASLRMVGVEDLRGIISAGGDALSGLLQQFDMMRALQCNEGITLLDKNDVYQTSQYAFSGLSETVLQFAQQLAGAGGIPLVRLLGQSPAGLNATGESDIRMYYDTINSTQEARLRNGWHKLLRVLYRSTYGKPEPVDLEFSFVPLWQMSAMDKSNIAKGNAETVVGAYEAGLLTKQTTMKELRDQSGETGLFGNITDEEIEEAKEEDDNPPLPGGEAGPLETGQTGNTALPNGQSGKPELNTIGKAGVSFGDDKKPWQKIADYLKH